MKDEISLITRNTEEIVTQEELYELVKRADKPKAYVGYEPSGEIHLGHMITVNKLIDLQTAGSEVIVLLADYHAYLNEKGDLDEIRRISEYNKRCFIAMGLEPKKTRFILGSDFQLEPDYMDNMLRLAKYITLSRARRSMDEISRRKEDLRMAQMIYPLMQAVDIAMLGIDIAVGGIDQRKIHMLARDFLPKLGSKPPICIHSPILLGLDGEKMSSSERNYISIDATEAEISKKIKAAFCPPSVDNNPIIQIFQHHIFPRLPEIKIKRPAKYGGNLYYTDFGDLKEEYEAGNIHPLDLKNAAMKHLIEILAPIRDASTS